MYRIIRSYVSFILNDDLGVALTHRYDFPSLAIFSRNDVSRGSHKDSLVTAAAVVVDLAFMVPPARLIGDKQAQERWNDDVLKRYNIEDRSIHAAVGAPNRKQGGLAVYIGLGRFFNVGLTTSHQFLV
jgi:hypothetical protein